MPDSAGRYFVRIFVGDQNGLGALAGRGLDLVRGSLLEGEGGLSIDGSLTLAQVAELVGTGLDVMVRGEVPAPPLEIDTETAYSLDHGEVRVPTGYQPSYLIERTIRDIAQSLPQTCTSIRLPETSFAGNQIHALRFRGGDATDRQGVLLLGGAHSNELINPDLLANWIFRMAYAYSTGTGVHYGPTSYDHSTIAMLINGLDIFVVPLVNPDGRDYVFATQDDEQRKWRKNRAPIPGSPHLGVDLNRNYDFLFDSSYGGASTDPKEKDFRGPHAFSEPETRNIRWLLDTYPHIGAAVDVHSYGRWILYPWGDDDNQTTDPAQNFRVPNPYRGRRGDTLYREYIPPADLAWYQHTAQRLKAAIARNRGENYTVLQSFWLYPTSGTHEDYAYSRRFLNPALASVRHLTLETSRNTGRELESFQPPYAEARRVWDDVGPALIEFCLEILCPSGSGTDLVRAARIVLDRHLAADDPTRDQIIALGPRILAALDEHPDVRARATAALRRLAGQPLDHDGAAELDDAARLVADLVPEARAALSALTAAAPSGTPR